MKRLLFISAFLLVAFGIQAQQQSISQPVAVPLHCVAGQTNPCKLIVSPNATLILIAKESSGGAITDSLGGTWVRDFCTTFDYGECIFHANFNYSYPIGDILSFPSFGYTDVYVLQYEGIWSFVIGQQGTYAAQNAPFPDCAGGGDCPYDWTLPVEPDVGSLLIAYSFPQATGPELPKAGLGWSIEANDGFLAVEDMIAPIGGVPYIGSLTWKDTSGVVDQGSHWLMGIGVYARLH